MVVYKVIRYKNEVIARRQICQFEGDGRENTAARVLDDLYEDLYRGFRVTGRSLVSSKYMGCVCVDRVTLEDKPENRFVPKKEIKAEFEVWEWECSANPMVKSEV